VRPPTPARKKKSLKEQFGLPGHLATILHDPEVAMALTFSRQLWANTVPGAHRIVPPDRASPACHPLSRFVLDALKRPSTASQSAMLCEIDARNLLVAAAHMHTYTACSAADAAFGALRLVHAPLSTPGSCRMHVLSGARGVIMHIFMGRSVLQCCAHAGYFVRDGPKVISTTKQDYVWNEEEIEFMKQQGMLDKTFNRRRDEHTKFIEARALLSKTLR
jgi:hypothetical protein